LSRTITVPESPAFYFDILEYLAKGRCPACELVRSKPLHYIDRALYGLVTDPQAQNLFAETGGYCRRHAALLLEIPWGSALGVAILYNRLVEDASDSLRAGLGEPPRYEKRGGPVRNLFFPRRAKKPAREDNPDCLACRVERETEQGVLRTLVETLRAGDGRMTAAVEEQEGFCLFHLDAALALDPGERTAARLRRHGLRRAENLLGELKEFMRKSDYRFSKEPMGAEGDSWLRAAAWVTGIGLEKTETASRPGELKRKLREENDSRGGK
jgi:hypothetical protein